MSPGSRICIVEHGWIYLSRYSGELLIYRSVNPTSTVIHHSPKAEDIFYELSMICVPHVDCGSFTIAIMMPIRCEFSGSRQIAVVRCTCHSLRRGPSHEVFS